jgi:hypothetical protein
MECVFPFVFASECEVKAVRGRREMRKDERDHCALCRAVAE